ncbi:Hypothetical predicted protein [Mytilus galloprovincialis]|uniref:Uncharacterized protein n=1 Tax=Mytilus galloprovincialis TaxID=29158 RepID=A0A8B6DS90_MYTGA|nr:Hypothetical predicted protein [Mytilus galloprovincialis]
MAIETERQKQINKMYLSGIVFLGFMCVCLTFGYLTAKEIGNYDKQEFDEDIFQSPWNRIYIGAFIIAGVCLLHVLVICCIADHEKKNRRKEVGDCVGLSVLLLWVGVIACGTAAAFVGNFAVKTRVFNTCNGTALEEDSTKPCFEHLKTHTVTSKVTQQQHTTQPARSIPAPTVPLRQQQTQQPAQTSSFNFMQSFKSSNEENKHNTQKKNQVSTISSPINSHRDKITDSSSINSHRDKNTDSSSMEGDYTSEEVSDDTISDLSIPINHIEHHNDSETNQNIWLSHNYYMPPPPSSANIDVGQNDPYSREATLESPLPHASVFRMSNHSQQTRPPLPRFKSVSTIPPDQPPPAYEDLFK